MIEEKSWSALGFKVVSWALVSVLLNTDASFSESRDTIDSTSEYGVVRVIAIQKGFESIVVPFALQDLAFA